MAKRLGRVCPNRGGRSGWNIDFGRRLKPRNLYSSGDMAFQTREDAERVLHAIQGRVARGVPLEAAVEEYGPASRVKRETVERWVGEYLAEQVERADRLEISPTHLRELRRYARHDGDAWNWWYRDGLTVHEISGARIREWVRWLQSRRSSRSASASGRLAPKSVKNIVVSFRTFVRWLYSLEKIARVPPFPPVRVPDYTPTLLSAEDQAAILNAPSPFDSLTRSV
jgi:transposase